MKIKQIEQLTQRLEQILRDIPSTLSLHEYEQVGWAVRPLRTLLDQCRTEAASMQWAQEHAPSFARVLPKGARL